MPKRWVAWASVLVCPWFVDADTGKSTCPCHPTDDNTGMPPQFSRRDALKRAAQFGLAGSILPSLTSSLLAADPAARTNILYIMTDDHAAHALSCYGSRINKTPNLDRIATGGMRFENCFVTNALCGPSRATLLTGKYSHMNGFRDNKADSKFDGSQVTFPKLHSESAMPLPCCSSRMIARLSAQSPRAVAWSP